MGSIFIIPPSGVTDHGSLTGLDDDDHAQYHTDARGDARYSPIGHTHPTLPTADQKAALVGGDPGSNPPNAGNPYVTLAEVGALGGGTVTSVSVSATDGLEVDSGSPITTAGTIALGVSAPAMRAHINVQDGATDDTAADAAQAAADAAQADATQALSDAAGAQGDIGAHVALAAEHIDWTQPGAGTIDPDNYAAGGGQTDTVQGDGIGIENTGTDVDAVLSPIFGTTPGTIAEGNDSRIPTSDQKDALTNAPTSPNSGNPFVTLADVGALGGGTVTSVTVTGTQGITDSGNPITTAGTVTLAVDAPTLRSTLNVADGATDDTAANAAQADATQALADAATADGKADAAQADATQALADAATADGKADANAAAIAGLGTAAQVDTGTTVGTVPVHTSDGELTLDNGTGNLSYLEPYGIYPGNDNPDPYDFGGSTQAAPQLTRFIGTRSNADSVKAGGVIVRGGTASGTNSVGGDIEIYGGVGTLGGGDLRIGGYDNGGTDAPLEGDVRILKGFTIREQAARSYVPTAGRGEVWIRSSDHKLIYTDGTTGTDTDVTDGGGGTPDPGSVGLTELADGTPNKYLGYDGAGNPAELDPPATQQHPFASLTFHSPSTVEQINDVIQDANIGVIEPGGIVQLDNTGILPALDGSQLQNLPPSGGGTPDNDSVDLDQMAPSTVGEILSYDNAGDPIRIAPISGNTVLGGNGIGNAVNHKSGSVSIQINAGDIEVLPVGVDHDQLLNYIADRHTRIWQQTDTPTPDGIGDIWLHTTTMALTRWDGASWVLIGIGVKKSLEVDAGEVQLVNDELAPGNSKYYGTDGGGTKGFHDLPAGGGLVGGGAFVLGSWTQTADGGGAPASGQWDIQTGSSGTPSGVTQIRIHGTNAGAVACNAILERALYGGSFIRFEDASGNFWVYRITALTSFGGGYYSYNVASYTGTAAYTFPQSGSFTVSLFATSGVQLFSFSHSFLLNMGADSTNYFTAAALGGIGSRFDAENYTRSIGATVTSGWSNGDMGWRPPINGVLRSWQIQTCCDTTGTAFAFLHCHLMKLSKTANGTGAMSATAVSNNLFHIVTSTTNQSQYQQFTISTLSDAVTTDGQQYVLAFKKGSAGVANTMMVTSTYSYAVNG